MALPNIHCNWNIKNYVIMMSLKTTKIFCYCSCNYHFLVRFFFRNKCIFLLCRCDQHMIFIFFQSLSRLKDEFLMNKHGGSSPDVSTLSIPLKSSTASQTDLRGEVSTAHCLTDWPLMQINKMYKRLSLRQNWYRTQPSKLTSEVKLE